MSEKKEIILSGIRSTGNLHLGNYFGGKLVLRLHRYPDAEIIVSKKKAQRLKEWIDR